MDESVPSVMSPAPIDNALNSTHMEWSDAQSSISDCASTSCSPNQTQEHCGEDDEIEEADDVDADEVSDEDDKNDDAVTESDEAKDEEMEFTPCTFEHYYNSFYQTMSEERLLNKYILKTANACYSILQESRAAFDQASAEHVIDNQNTNQTLSQTYHQTITSPSPKIRSLYYVSAADIRAVKEVCDDTLIAVAAPSGSMIAIPEPPLDLPLKKAQFRLRSPNQQTIGVFLVPRNHDGANNRMYNHLDNRSDNQSNSQPNSPSNHQSSQNPSADMQDQDISLANWLSQTTDRSDSIL